MARPFQFDKSDVLNKAMILFWEKGYFNTSFHDIVDRLELSRSSIYNSFSDKRVLFIESLRFYISKESQSLITSLNALPSTPESIKNILRLIVANNFSGAHPKGCLVVNTAIEFSNHDKEIQKIIEDNVRDVIFGFTDFIKSGQDLGDINPLIEAHDLAISLFHQITSLRVMATVISDESFFESTINTFIQVFITPKN